jgi:hypothetical protein
MNFPTVELCQFDYRAASGLVISEMLCNVLWIGMVPTSITQLRLKTTPSEVMIEPI